VQTTITFSSNAAPDVLFALVDNLNDYPRWLDLVASALPADANATDAGPAWTVELRARLGPIARHKRLRMVRTVHEPGHVTFERHELDGRTHAAWTMDVVVASSSERDGGSVMAIELRYEGRLGGALLERMLADEVERATPKLRALAE
jgi:hypothetical protein